MDRQAPYVILTDLDGTLLDQDSHSSCGAEPALERLQAHEVPLVFCTSQTRAEVETVRTELHNQEPFIVENGGAVYIPENYFPFPVPASKTSGAYQVIELGVPYSEIVAKLRHAAELTGSSVRGFHEMSVAEVAERCHMSVRAAEFAKQREYDEPLDILSESSSVICSFFDRIEQEGLTWTRGGRLYHIRGHHNKGQAALALLDLYRKWRPNIVSVGLGDGLNDISLLEAVDVPIVIPNPRNRVPLPALLEAEGGVAEQPGPRGWNRAVLKVLEGTSAGVMSSGI